MWTSPALPTHHQTPELQKAPACNRCKRQKLRCCRPSASEPCLRCGKARIQCVTGPAGRVGRPSRSSITCGSNSSGDKDAHGTIQACSWTATPSRKGHGNYSNSQALGDHDDAANNNTTAPLGYVAFPHHEHDESITVAGISQAAASVSSHHNAPLHDQPGPLDVSHTSNDHDACHQSRPVYHIAAVQGDTTPNIDQHSPEKNTEVLMAHPELQQGHHLQNQGNIIGIIHTSVGNNTSAGTRICNNHSGQRASFATAANLHFERTQTPSNVRASNSSGEGGGGEGGLMNSSQQQVELPRLRAELKKTKDSDASPSAADMLVQRLQRLHEILFSQAKLVQQPFTSSFPNKKSEDGYHPQKNNSHPSELVLTLTRFSELLSILEELERPPTPPPPAAEKGMWEMMKCPSSVEDLSSLSLPDSMNSEFSCGSEYDVSFTRRFEYSGRENQRGSSMSRDINSPAAIDTTIITTIITCYIHLVRILHHILNRVYSAFLTSNNIVTAVAELDPLIAIIPVDTLSNCVRVCTEEIKVKVAVQMVVHVMEYAEGKLGLSSVQKKDGAAAGQRGGGVFTTHSLAATTMLQAALQMEEASWRQYESQSQDGTPSGKGGQGEQVEGVLWGPLQQDIKRLVDLLDFRIVTLNFCTVQSGSEFEFEFE